MKFCLDANIFITNWNDRYPIDRFPSLWKKLADQKNKIVIIQPVFDEIDPVSNFKKLSTEARKKYPLRTWLEQSFTPSKIDGKDEQKALELRKIYEVNNNSSGLSETDTLLVAYSNNRQGHIVVTYEKEQTEPPSKKYNTKIPLACKNIGQPCISFVDMLKKINIVV